MDLTRPLDQIHFAKCSNYKGEDTFADTYGFQISCRTSHWSLSREMVWEMQKMSPMSVQQVSVY